MKLKNIKNLRFGVCYDFSCHLVIGNHPPFYYDVKQKLIDLPDDKPLCQSCQDSFNAKVWGDIKDVVIPTFHNPMDRIIEILIEHGDIIVDSSL